MVRFAVPELFKLTRPNVLEPSLKLTIPEGMPPLPLTVAVKVMAVPTVAGFCEEVTVVALGSIDAGENTITVAE